MNNEDKSKLIDLINADQLHAAFEILHDLEATGNMTKKISKKNITDEIKRIIAHAINDTDDKVQSSVVYILNNIEESEQKNAINSLLDQDKNSINEAILYNAHKLPSHPKIKEMISSTLSSTDNERRSSNLLKAAAFAKIATEPNTANEFITDSEDEQIIKGAIKALATLPEDIIKEIIPVIQKNNNNQIKISLIDESISLPDSIKDQIITSAFKDQDSTVTDASIELIQKLESQEIIKYLNLALQSKNIILKLKAGQLIEELSQKDESFMSLRDKLLKDEEVNTQINSLNVSDQAQSLLNTSKQSDEIIEWLSGQDLGKLPPDIATPLIKKILSSGSSEEKVQSINSTYFMPWQSSAPLIEIALNDSEKSVRWAATSLLRHLPIAHALPLLAVAMQDEDYFVRKESTRSLGENYSRVTEPLLNRALKDDSEFVRSEAAKFIHKFSKNIPSILSKALKDDSEKVRSSAAFSLTHLDPTEYKDIMNASINSPDPKIRGGLAQGIYNFKGARLDKVLTFLLKDSSDVVRRKLFSQLDNIKEDQGTLSKLIKKGIIDTSSAIRLDALESSTNLEESEALEIQLKATHDNEAMVRSAAIKLIALNL